jgi:hypothetical protein
MLISRSLMVSFRVMVYSLDGSFHQVAELVAAREPKAAAATGAGG